MADNFIVKDGNSTDRTFRTTDNAGVHTGHNNIDSLPGTVESDISTINTSTSTVAGTISGSEMQVDIVAPIPSGSNTIGKAILAPNNYFPYSYEFNTSGNHALHNFAFNPAYISMTAAADVTVTFTDGVGGTVLNQAILTKGVPYNTPYIIDGVMPKSTGGNDIIANLSADVYVSIYILGL